MNSTLKRLIKLAQPVRSWMLLAALLGSLTVMSGIGLLSTSAYLISAAALQPSVSALSIAIVGVRFFGIARGVFRYLERLTSHRATFRLLANLRVWFFSSLEPLMPARILRTKEGQQRELRSGDLLRRAVADIDILQNFYLRVLAPPMIAAVIAVVMWILLGAFGGIFPFIFIGFFLLSSVVVPWLAHRLGRTIGAEMIATRAELHTQMLDSIQGIADLVAFGQEERQAQRILGLNKQLNTMQMTMSYITGLQSSITNFLMNMTAWTILLVAIPIAASGQMNAVFLALLVLSTLASFEIVLPMASAFQQVGSNVAAANRLFEIVDSPPAVRDPIQPSPQPANNNITISNLNFRYAHDEPYVLQDITIAVKQGECIAIVGPSGSGKSTLARLLLRFWDYQEGQITLGSHPLHNYKQDDLYQLVSVVEQDTHLFNTTIRENIMIARPKASEEELITAAKQAQLHDFVLTLPQGYNTPVGEQGLRLSGGERQRVAIARAFLKDAPIIILDEPTINLDAITERAVLQALRTLRQGRTTIMVTHRLAEMDMANEIIVLQNGHIIERGTHTELLDHAQLYARMWNQQNRTVQIA